MAKFIPTILLSLTIPLTAFGEADKKEKREETCPFSPEKPKKYVWGTFWAQEYVGADLLREELNRADKLSLEDISDFVQIWDTSLGHHGVQVGHILGGPYPSGVVPREESLEHLDLYGPELLPHEYVEQYENFYDLCVEGQNCPSYVNNSMKWGSSPPQSDSISKTISRMYDESAILTITAAGNSTALVDFNKSRLAKQEKLIIVGSLTPNGNPSSFSSDSSETTISAPSDDSIASYNSSGERTAFGGTSGATPLVTGTLSAFTKITGHPLSGKEAIHLLQKTALPFPYLPSKSRIGAGILNSYKIGMVAFRLKKKCHQNKKCFSRELLQSEKIYRFKTNHQKLFQSLKTSFPHCALDAKKESLEGNEEEQVEEVEEKGVICEDKQDIFKKFRRAAFLNPHDSSLWKAISCMDEERNKVTSSFYASLGELGKNGDRDQREDLFKSRHLSLEDTLEMIQNDKSLHKRFLFYYIRAASEKVALSSKEDGDKDLSQEFLKHYNIFTDHPSITGDELLQPLRLLYNYNWDLIPPIADFVRHVLEHPKSNETTLLYAIHLTSFPYKNNIHDDLKGFLQMILDHPTAKDSALAKVAWEAGKAPPHSIPEYEDFLQSILNHPATENKALTEVVSAASKKSDEVPRLEAMLGQVVEHPAVQNKALVWVVTAAWKNTEKIVGFKALLKSIIDHPKIGAYPLTEITRKLGTDENANKTAPFVGAMLQDIVAHPKASDTTLHLLGKAALKNAEKIADLKAFFQAILHHPNMKKYVLTKMAKDLEKYGSQVDASFLETTLQAIIDHPKVTDSALIAAMETITKHSDKISTQTFLDRIAKNHRNQRVQDALARTKQKLEEASKS
ncbi:MAG: S8 family serine peptidase [Bacteriovoracales bacterium]|nr:S8 family serine peptidase [Bacteriovoracales bacterium]